MALDGVTATLIAGLGGALIGGGAAVSGAVVQSHRQIKSERDVAKRAAYTRLIATTGLLVHTAHTLHIAMQIRSGLKEGVDVTTRVRKPLEALELNAELRRDLDPLYNAWADIWTIGTPVAVRAANELIGHAGRVMGTATARGEARRGITRVLVGEKWTPEQLAAWNDSIKELAESRRRFAEVARSELGSEVADLFASRLDGEEI